MKRTLDLFGNVHKPEPKRRRTERGELVDWFLMELNPSRVEKGYPPLSHGRLSFMLSGIPTKDLYALQSKMRDAEKCETSAGIVFWAEVKTRRKAREKMLERFRG